MHFTQDLLEGLLGLSGHLGFKEIGGRLGAIDLNHHHHAHAQMRLLYAAALKLLVVGPYLADARPGPRGPEPTHFREEFRTRGPSNYNHGKQADLAS